MAGRLTFPLLVLLEKLPGVEADALRAEITGERAPASSCAALSGMCRITMGWKCDAPRQLFGFAVSLDFVESLHGLLADLAHPTGRASRQFGMVFDFPNSCCSPQCLSLTIELDFALS